MASYSFDELSDLEDAKNARILKPFWAINQDSEDEILKWVTGEFNFLVEDAKDRIESIHKNVASYKGLQYEAQSSKRSTINGVIDENKTKVNKIVVNHLHDLTESHVSRAVKYRPGISVSPANGEEFNDAVSAKMAKGFLDHIWYEKNFREGMFPGIVRDSKVAGEDYLFIEWNPDLGDELPAYSKKKEMGSDTIKTSDNQEIKLEKPVRIGEVEYEQVCADSVFLQKKKKFNEVEYCFRVRPLNVEDLKAMYPEAAGSIKTDLGTQYFDYDTMQMKKMQNEALLVTFWHKPTERLPKGKKVVFVKEKILESDDFPYKHKRLPFVRLPDLELPNERHAISYFHNIRPMTSMYNNLTNMIIRNQLLVSHPKWVMPAGAAKLESLGNDITIVQYKGGVAPQLVSMAATPAEIFSFRKELKEEFQTLSGVHGVSRGEPPAGVKAGVAMQFLNEQENERANNFMLKINEFLRLVADMTISVAGQYYKKSDNRMIKIQGKNNEWMLKHFDPEWLNSSFDIRVANSSALPESKAQRTQNIIELNESFPGMFTNEQVLEMLDLANAEKFVDAAIAAQGSDALRSVNFNRPTYTDHVISGNAVLDGMSVSKREF